MDWLEEILKDVEGKDELVKAIKKGIGSNFVSKSDFNAKNEELKNLKTQLKDRDTQLEELKKNNQNSNELQKQIEELQKTNKQKEDEYNKNIHKLKMDNAINIAISGKVYDENIVSSLLDRDKLVLSDDGKIVGLDEQINSLKESKSFLFKADDQQNKVGFKGIEGENTGSKVMDKNPQDMSYEDFLALETEQ